MKEEMLSISEAARLMDVCENTLRDWDIEGKFLADRTAGGHRRYSLSKIRDYLDKNPIVDKKSLSEIQYEIDELKYKGIEFWKEFTDEVEDSHQKRILSMLLSNAYIYYIDAAERDLVRNMFSIKQTLWLTKESWLKSIFKNMVSVQPMSGPVDLIYYLKDSKITSDAVAARIIKLGVNFFEDADFDTVKNIYAKAIALEIDSYIFNNLLLNKNKLNCETLMDGLNTVPETIITEIKNAYDYVIGPEILINKLKGLTEVDLFVIEPTIDPDSFHLLACGGKYPTSKFAFPIFAPYILFLNGSKAANWSTRVVYSRLGYFLEAS